MVQNLQEVESMGTDKMDTKQEQRNKENEEIREMGTMELGKKGNPYGIQLLTIIGEIEGHENVSGNTKATKYEHLLPRLAEAEENDEIEGVLYFTDITDLYLSNTMLNMLYEKSYEMIAIINMRRKTIASNYAKNFQHFPVSQRRGDVSGVCRETCKMPRGEKRTAE